ncbi:MAG TPA: biotin/lipoyl-binding protein [Rhizomicrobium sp.]|nr:biotin/lipoyl-binding protein [Rhizomicrobium sp.]
MHQPLKPLNTRQSLSGLLGGVTGIRVIFAMAVIGVAAGLASAYVSAQPIPSQPPAFNPAANPFGDGIYANGIVESAQSHGENIAIFPEVPGPITRLFVSEGASVKKGQPLLAIDDSIQRQTTAQLEAQVRVAEAQIGNARANLKTASDTLAKQEDSFARDPQSVSRDTLDTDRNNAAVQKSNVEVAETSYVAALKAAAASEALLAKYTIRAPEDGVVMSIESAVGSYVSTQGAYDAYTQGYLPLIVMGSNSGTLEVRSYIDEILINRLPPPSRMTARMFIQGTNISVPLTFARMQPYVSPKIELSDQRLEQVDVRVLPVIFRFQTPPNVKLFPGQLVDVYVGTK